jgi:hypothetical protein
MTCLKFFCTLSITLCSICKAYAGGPLAIEGSSGNTPVHYSPSTVTINYDIGTLGTRSNSTADGLVLQAFNLWNNVSTATLQLSQGTDLSADIDDTNYFDLIPDGSQNHPSSSDNLNPMVYDDDGQIVDDIFGIGASNDIAGFAASVYFVGDDKFQEGYAVLNGKLPLTDSDIISLVTHEIGHFFGLDHSQLNIDNTETDSGAPAICSTASQDKYPVMYPFLCRLEISLHVDDIAAVSALYPASNITTSFGQINGSFVDTSGNPILGANLWVENTVTGATYSIVSDYLVQNTGFFSIYLPAGTYTLHANSINPIFFGASSVGPYSATAIDPSFQAPHPITPVSFEGSTPGSDEIITILAGAAKQVNFMLDGSGNVSVGTIITPPTSTPPLSDDGGMISLPVLLWFATGLVYLRRRQQSIT